KYTIDDRGLDWFRDEVQKRAGAELEEPRQYAFVGNGDVYSWQKDDRGSWHYTLFIENGRVADVADRRLMSGLRAIAEVHQGEFRLTPNQNLSISDISPADKARIERLLSKYNIENSEQATPLRLHSMACVAMPTCALAMAESERYLPALIDKLETAMADAGLSSDAITIRMTGCPNGCARPYIAEIGLVGKGPGRYNLYLGAGFAGDRLGSLYLDNATETEILDALAPLLARYRAERNDNERFGDFLVRANVVKAVRAGRYFHADRSLDMTDERA
ncbi:MAG: sulfite reductase, partial [Gammaproteobacteria bacterium]|nr:sulfite reductase [Gammaproteobacteria bacterium]